MWWNPPVDSRLGEGGGEREIGQKESPGKEQEGHSLSLHYPTFPSFRLFKNIPVSSLLPN